MMPTKNDAKRPRSGSSNSDEQAAVLDQLVENFQKIAKPDVTDLSEFLVQFLKSSNNLNTRFNTVDDRVTALEERCDQKDTHIQNIEDQLHELEVNQKTLKSELEDQIHKLSERLEDNILQSEHNSTQTLYIQQSLMDKEIILKGFPTKPDPEIVVENFVKFFEVDKTAIKEYYHVSYSKNQAEASTTTNQKLSHFVVIGFKNKSTKISVFAKKKKKGSPLLKNLIPQSSSPETLIKCANKLTKFNLYVQRVLYKVHQQKTIKEYRYHNHLFQIKLEEDGKWIRIDTYKKVNELDQQIIKNKPSNQQTT